MLLSAPMSSAYFSSSNTLCVVRKRGVSLPPLSAGYLGRCMWQHSRAALASKVSARRKEEKEAGVCALPKGLRKEYLPEHVAFIMDGNSRWARAKGLPLAAGYEAGVRALRQVLTLSSAWGIRVVTVFAFSLDNWSRPNVEVKFLMGLFESVLRQELDAFRREGVQLCVAGDTSKLPITLQKLVAEAVEATKVNWRLRLVVAVSYSGRSDIVQACRKIACRVRDGELRPVDINESIFEQELETRYAEGFVDPDLVIRTSGELRLSNFFLWQLAYSELFFTKNYWPDFGKDEYAEALLSYQHRQRRFGKRDELPEDKRLTRPLEEPHGVTRELFG